MFTGIIKEVGRVKSVKFVGNSAKIAVECDASDIERGDSIAVNGACLTAVSVDGNGFSADVSEETLNRTSLKRAVPNQKVNVEPALRMNGKLGGHIVQGHVDGVGRLLKISRSGDFYELIVSAPENVRKYVAEKGSIAVDGVSLTIPKDFGDSFSVAIVPHTYANTNFHALTAGDFVNIEVDVIARYAEKLLGSESKDERLKSMLAEF
jgi:riboflavin synthase